ncbi:helix-turn-helix domain-containing protein [Rhizobium herbae]|jgi:hypothetical protein|uniref:Helix-turn-helix domain-containing protein n=1 Tax=Rhizobium herbae TaxID=508661 RepID=A0ABS7H4G9_9HYPH|nr:helix-turn-helix domain-containing protein [Rhizobium herbae]
MALTRHHDQTEKRPKKTRVRLTGAETERKPKGKRWPKYLLFTGPGKFAPSGIHLNTQQAADYLNLSVKTLQNWRVQKRGPAFRKYENGSVRYDLRTIQKWAARQSRTSTSETK